MDWSSILDGCRCIVVASVAVVVVVVVATPVAMLATLDCPEGAVGKFPVSPTTDDCRAWTAAWLWLALDAAILCSLIVAASL